MPITNEPGLWNWTIYAGQTLSRSLTVTSGTAAVNLTGYTAALMARTDYPAGSAVLSLGTANITLGGTAGTITINQTAAQTAAIGSALAYVPTSLVYDLELTTGADVTRLLQGVVVIQPEATR